MREQNRTKGYCNLSVLLETHNTKRFISHYKFPITHGFHTLNSRRIRYKKDKTVTN